MLIPNPYLPLTAYLPRGLPRRVAGRSSDGATWLELGLGLGLGFGLGFGFGFGLGLGVG